MQKSQNKYPAQRSSTASRAPSRRYNSLPASRASDPSDRENFTAVMKNSLFGLLGFAVSGLALVTVMCAIAYSSSDPGALITPLALVALLASSFIGGLISSRLTRKAPLLCGVVCGAMCAVAMLALSLCLVKAPSSMYSFGSGLLMHAFALLFSVLGSFTGNLKRKVNPKKRRYGNA